MHPNIAFLLGKIRSQSPQVRARWKERTKNQTKRQAKRLVLRQWLEEVANPT